MTTTPKPVTVEQVMAATGLTKRQIFRLTKQGRIPASIVSRTFVMFPPQFDQLLREGIGPEPEKPETEEQPQHEPIDFLRTRKAS